MADWLGALRADPVPWLLEEESPAVRHLALRDILGEPADALDVVAARTAAMRSNPIAAILEAQDAEGWWAKPGPGYLPKYTATTWQLSFLEQMGADGGDPRIRAGCEFVLRHTQTASGAFGYASKGDGPPPPSGAVLCLNGNVLRALVGFGWLDDDRVARSVAWQAGAITGEDGFRYYGYACGPGFRCGANGKQPCAWGAVKALLALARVPPAARTRSVQRAIDAGVEFLLSRDPAAADYPTAEPGARPSGSWFKLGFPLGYVADVLQVLEAVVAAGAAGDRRLGPAVAWLLERQDPQGRWTNDYAYAGKMIANVDRQGQPSKWVTLRACRVLKAVAAAN